MEDSDDPGNTGPQEEDTQKLDRGEILKRAQAQDSREKPTKRLRAPFSKSDDDDFVAEGSTIPMKAVQDDTSQYDVPQHLIEKARGFNQEQIETAESVKKFKTLEIKLEPIDDEPPQTPSEERVTSKLTKAIQFVAEIDEAGRVSLPEELVGQRGLFEEGQVVRVTIEPVKSSS